MSALTKLQRLEFAIGLRDNASSKLGKLMASIDKAAKHVPEQFKRAGLSVMGAWGGARGLSGILNPAVEFNRAFGEVRSLDVAEGALKNLDRQAKLFAVRFGGNAADVVRASYDIQSAIAGLKGNELGAFAYSSALLAKATKADAATITNYMGTMYGIFKKTADQMGKAEWVEQLTGQTAAAVQMFKTTGAEMNAAFSSLGAAATAAGIDAAEQMAVLGTLQATMGGSSSGTHYSAFLRGVGRAQAILGLKFTGEDGRMLSVTDILGKIEGKFGKNLTVGQTDEIKAAFGSVEASKFVQQLLQDTKGLAASIDALGRVNGLDKATGMARSMTDVWMRARGASNAVAVSFGQKLLPPVEKLVGLYADCMGWVGELIERFPTLTRLIGVAAMATLGFSSALGALGAASAVWGLVRSGAAALKLGTVAMKGYTAAHWLFSFAVGAARGALFLFKLTAALTADGLVALGKGFISAVPKILAFSAALLSNPLTWIVLGIVAVIASLGALFYWWDDIKAAAGRAAEWVSEKWSKAGDWISGKWRAFTNFMGDTWWGQKIGYVLGELNVPFTELPHKIMKLWGELTEFLADTWWGRAILKMLDFILAPFKAFTDGIIKVGKYLGFIDEDFSFDLGLAQAPAGGAAVAPAGVAGKTPAAVPLPEALAEAQTVRSPEGGIKRELAVMQSNSRSTDNSTHIGEQHIHVEQRLGSDDLRDAWALEV